MTTLPEMWWGLMDAPSVETPYCAVCGATWPLNRHHMVRRSAGRLYRAGVEVPKPTIVLCGSGNAGGCHGLAHGNRLHFRWVSADYRSGEWWLSGCRGGHLEYLLTDEPVDYLHALEMDGWRPLRGRS